MKYKSCLAGLAFATVAGGAAEAQYNSSQYDVGQSTVPPYGYSVIGPQNPLNPALANQMLAVTATSAKGDEKNNTTVSAAKTNPANPDTKKALFDLFVFAGSAVVAYGGLFWVTKVANDDHNRIDAAAKIARHPHLEL